jgi:hypothetical protein
MTNNPNQAVRLRTLHSRRDLPSKGPQPRRPQPLPLTPIVTNLLNRTEQRQSLFLRSKRQRVGAKKDPRLHWPGHRPETRPPISRRQAQPGSQLLRRRRRLFRRQLSSQLSRLPASQRRLQQGRLLLRHLSLQPLSNRNRGAALGQAGSSGAAAWRRERNSSSDVTAT